MKLPLFIARRYLFARKSHQVINIISAVSVAGMAIGTAALILILSVYNGFNAIVAASLDDSAPDLRITPAGGKVFIPEGPAWDWLYDQSSVATLSEVLEDNVFLRYGDKRDVAFARGVDRVFEEENPIREHLVSGELRLQRGDVTDAALSAGLARSLDASPTFTTPLEIFYPDRSGRLSPSNPAASLHSTRAGVCAVYHINSQTDGKTLLLPIGTMRELLGYEGEVSAVEVRFTPDATPAEGRKLTAELEKRLGPGFRVSDRFAQNAAIYRMMKYEKLAIFLILLFVIIIVAFNIFGSLSMLIIEKRDDIGTLRCLGASDGLIRRIFVLEGWLTAVLGLAIGLVIGVGLALLQQRFGWIKMPGGFLMQSYPVILKATDLLAVAASVALVGWLIALIPPVRTSGPRPEGAPASD